MRRPVRTPGRNFTQELAWRVLPSTPMHGESVTGHHVVLICADEPLRSALVELARNNGYQPREPETPREALDALLESGDRIGHAVISCCWSDDLDTIIGRELLHLHCCPLSVA